MIIGKYINREVIKTMMVVLLVLLVLFVGQRFIMYLSAAAQGRFASDFVLTLLWLQTPVFISYLLPLSLFLGLIITLGKMHADHEMAVMSACGISQAQLLVYFVPLAIGLSVLTGYLTLFQAPKAIYTQQQILQEQKSKGDLSLITAGRFQQASDGKRIAYVESLSDDNQLSKVFFVQQSDDSEHQFSLIIAEQGRYWSDENQHNFLVLENGNQYQGSPGNNRLSSMSFERYFMELKTTKKMEPINKLKALPTEQLLSQMTLADIAELQWRIAAPVSIPLLLLLAIPLARVPPREGKFARILPGLMVYIIYMILLLTMRSAVEDGKIPPMLGNNWVHLLFLLYAYSEFTQWQWLKKLLPAKQKQTANRVVP